MLSIVIPTYNYDTFNLASELHKQAVKAKITFEILVYDDASPKLFENNYEINNLTFGKYLYLNKNIGRSAIRNLLAYNAQYKWLLFLDADTFPEKKDFIKQYLSNLNHKVVRGGIAISEMAPKKPYKLRWLFTKKRESNKNSSANFLIEKDIFSAFPFDESLKKYGYEDVLFFNTLIKNNIAVYAITNQVYHLAEDDANSFLKKTENAIENLLYLEKNNKIEKDWSRILQYHSKLETLKLTVFTANVFKTFRNLLIINFNSSYPFLVLYDFYRLGYYCLIKNKK